MPTYLLRLLALVPATMLMVACSTDRIGPLPQDPDTTIDLREAIGVTTLQVVGVTVDPVSGQRYVLDQVEGIFEIADDGSATLVSSIADLPIPFVLPQSLWTDFVAMGESRFALTALSDGYLLDLAQDTMVEYFCYLPDDMPWEQQQLTHSVTFDPEAGLIYAQPITFEEGGFEAPVALASSIGAYSLEGGQPTSWFNVDDPEFLAHGAAVDSDGTLLLGSDNALYRFDPAGEGELSLLGILTSVSRIEGLAVDLQRDQLLVVDGDSGLLVILPLDAL
jgi:hypothetical protein